MSKKRRSNPNRVIRLAINGFGRIGRASFKVALDYPEEIEVVAINDLTTPKVLAYLLAHDSVYGNYDKKISYTDKSIAVDGKEFPIYAEKDPAMLPWKKLDVDIVLECTGFFTEKEGAEKHLQAGAKKVIISAPTKSEDIGTYVLGVNQDQMTEKDDIIANASCTTNAVAPVAKIIDEEFGLIKGMMSTTHAYTAMQNLVDGPSKKDLRRGRAAAENIVPTTTGAAEAVIKTLPKLKGIFDGMSIRVPVACVSIADFTMLIKRKTTVEDVNEVFVKAAKNPAYKDVLAVTEEELVSSDFIGNPYSSIVDLTLTKVIDGDLIKVVAWYDNEYGYAHQLVRQAIEVGKLI